jgi:hypothetical protein
VHVVRYALLVRSPFSERKPIDPPPILQLDVANRADPSKHFMQSPYLFVVASLYKADVDEPYDGHFNKGLGGTLVSSLHRLKDINNEGTPRSTKGIGMA